MSAFRFGKYRLLRLVSVYAHIYGIRYNTNRYNAYTNTLDLTKSVEWLFTIFKTAHLTIVTVKKATHYLTGHNNIADRHAGNDFSENIVINVHLSSLMTCHMFGVGKHDMKVPRIVLAHCV